ncbi:MAG: hypothetical protein IJ571_00180 [Ruminococcus sp.]|nr:hypothetical protein [Ruminococcus sp.]
MKEHYPGKDYRQAYKDIKSFMLKNGFEHRQWSGYISTKPIDYSSITVLTVELSKKMPWLKDCVNKFDVTNVGKTFDCLGIIKSTTDISSNNSVEVDYLFSDVLSSSDPLDLTGHTSLN